MAKKIKFMTVTSILTALNQGYILEQLDVAPGDQILKMINGYISMILPIYNSNYQRSGTSYLINTSFAINEGMPGSEQYTIVEDEYVLEDGMVLMEDNLDDSLIMKDQPEEVA